MRSKNPRTRPSSFSDVLSPVGTSEKIRDLPPGTLQGEAEIVRASPVVTTRADLAPDCTENPEDQTDDGEEHTDCVKDPDVEHECEKNEHYAQDYHKAS